LLAGSKIWTFMSKLDHDFVNVSGSSWGSLLLTKLPA
jgi:hypothetical protein